MSHSASSSTASLRVQAWVFQDVLLEHYTYTAGSIEPLPTHSHEEYQFGLSFDCAGEYFYRGALHRIPNGCLSMLTSGEPHAPSQRRSLTASATFWMLYVPPRVLQTAAADSTGRAVDWPFFPAPYQRDAALHTMLLQLHTALSTPTTRLEQETLLLQLLTALVVRHARPRPTERPLLLARPAIMRVRDFLREHYMRNVSLQELADLADLSVYHFCRVFRAEMGVPPHEYQIQLRIERAKALLLRGVSLAQVAQMTGFYDQSHLGQHFKRLVGITPGRYAAESKNVLYRPERTS